MINTKSEAYAEERYITNVIMEKQNKLVQITFMEYAIGASTSNQEALNDYQVAYIVTSNHKTYSFMDYAIYSIEQDSVSNTILQLEQANAEQTVLNVNQGGFIDGKIDVAEDEEGDFEIVEIE